MSESKQSYIEKILTVNKELVSKTLDKTQEIAVQTVDCNRDIWLAGLGRFSDLRTGGKEVFDKLIVRSENLEATSRASLEKHSATAKVKVGETFDKMSGVAATASDKISNQNLDVLFNCPVIRSVKSLAAPASKIVDSIAMQLKGITARLNALVEKSTEVIAETPVQEEKAA